MHLTSILWLQVWIHIRVDKMSQVEIYDSTVFSEAISVLNNANTQVHEECNRGLQEAQNKLYECEQELANSQMLLQEAIAEEARCLAEVHRRELELAEAMAMYPPDPPYVAYCTEMLALAEAEYQKAVAHRMLMEQRVALVTQATTMAGEMVSTLTMRFNYGMAQAENITVAGCNRLQGAYNDVVKYEKNQMTGSSADSLSELKGSIGNVKTKIVLNKLSRDYVNEMKQLSPCPDTLGNMKDLGKLENTSPEIVKEKRQQFNNQRNNLIRKWEEENGREWPKYEQDVYDKNGNIVRKKGDYYEAHHIKPLTVGGENSAKNITPLHYDVHNDRQGIHAPKSNFSQICEKVKELQ